jgi:hypothetical protein
MKPLFRVMWEYADLILACYSSCTKTSLLCYLESPYLVFPNELFLSIYKFSNIKHEDN